MEIRAPEMPPDSKEMIVEGRAIVFNTPTEMYEWALATVAVDFAGRYAFTFDCDFVREKIGDLSTELIYDFWSAFAQSAKVNLFIKVENGRNDHHKAEAIFKAVAKAIRMACEIDRRASLTVPSTKGVL